MKNEIIRVYTPEKRTTIRVISLFIDKVGPITKFTEQTASDSQKLKITNKNKKLEIHSQVDQEVPGQPTALNRD